MIPKGQSEATCSHAYVKGGTHNWEEADGVMIFNKSVLPGYSALFRHYNDDMYLGKQMKHCLFCYCSFWYFFLFLLTVLAMLTASRDWIIELVVRSDFSWDFVAV